MSVIARKPWSILAMMALAGGLVAGCNEHTDKIRDITGNPSAFLNKDVTVAGEVTKSLRAAAGHRGRGRVPGQRRHGPGLGPEPRGRPAPRATRSD